MMRAALILVGVGSLVAMELGTPPRVAEAVNLPLNQSSVGVGDLRDTLATADRFEIPYFQNELPTQPVSFAERMPPADSTPIISEHARKTVIGNRHDAKTKKVAFVRPKPSPKIRNFKPMPKRRVANTYRSKVPMDVKPCRPNAFESFLNALNLRSGCEAA